MPIPGNNYLSPMDLLQTITMNGKRSYGEEFIRVFMACRKYPLVNRKRSAGGLACSHTAFTMMARSLYCRNWKKPAPQYFFRREQAAGRGAGHLPGYVSRMAPAQGGGIWLTVFAPRSQLN